MATPRPQQAAMRLNRAPYAEEMIMLRQIFLRAENKIISEISRKQAREFVMDMHTVLSRGS